MKFERDDVTFSGRVSFSVLPVEFTDTFKDLVTPSVSNVNVFKCSGSVTTITNFLSGSDGQTIKILGDGNTTVSNNSNISTNTGANKLLAVNKIYRFTYLQETAHWYEDE